MRIIFAIVLCASLCAIGVDARADDTSAKDEKARKEESKKLHKEATSAYKLGDYEGALDGYQAAYRVFPAPALLFNIAQCHTQLGNWDEAIFFYEGYLKDVPDASNRELVEELIREAKDNRTKAEEAERARAEELARQAAERKKAEEAALLAAEEANRKKDQETPHPSGRPIYKKWWFWTMVGGVAAGTAAAFAVASGGETVLPGGSLGTWDLR